MMARSWFSGWRLLAWVLISLVLLTLLLTQPLEGGSTG